MKTLTATSRDGQRQMPPSGRGGFNDGSNVYLYFPSGTIFPSDPIRATLPVRHFGDGVITHQRLNGVAATLFTNSVTRRLELGSQAARDCREPHHAASPYVIHVSNHGGINEQKVPQVVRGRTQDVRPL